MSDLKTFALCEAVCLINASKVCFYVQNVPGTSKSSSESPIVTSLSQYSLYGTHENLKINLFSNTICIELTKFLYLRCLYETYENFWLILLCKLVIQCLRNLQKR